jgi:hypothetical protein
MMKRARLWIGCFLIPIFVGVVFLSAYIIVRAPRSNDEATHDTALVVKLVDEERLRKLEERVLLCEKRTWAIKNILNRMLGGADE